MNSSFSVAAILFAVLFAIRGSAQTSSASAACPTISPNYPAPVTAFDWEAQLVLNGLKTPRSILFDGSGNLLVVQAGDSIINLELADNGDSCVSVTMTYVVKSTDLNHGMTLSNDGKILYASSVEAVYSWPYDVASRSASKTNKTIITGMSNGDHVTRTLLMSQEQPGVLVVSRGSNDNIDEGARDITSGRAQLKAFDLSNMTADSPPYDFTTYGNVIAWGLRNSVGLAEEPTTGGLYSVENSADEVTRNGKDVHQNNPGEEMNFHGPLKAATKGPAGNHGYPDCFALWNTSIPSLGPLQVGNQFTMAPNNTFNDTTCSSSKIPPRLTFQAHMAPLDIIFTPDGTEAYISFHGSWDRSDPAGYKVASIDFAKGSPVAGPNSTTSLKDIFTNQDISKCPNSCFRPVGLALDSKGRLFISSDATGEIWVLVRTNGQTPNLTGSPTAKNAPTDTNAPMSTQSKAGMSEKKSSQIPILVACASLPLILTLFW